MNLVKFMFIRKLITLPLKSLLLNATNSRMILRDCLVTAQSYAGISYAEFNYTGINYVGFSMQILVMQILAMQGLIMQS